ncbi:MULTISPECIES: hypothetical protein [Clostridium]|uniref:Uncharacterized protein n=1 Tax=Clostridium aquiflavi TaxID=3073603 RepID=A0ABU1ED78_9CLOT|nr:MULTISPECIES: hypothetical protein [unclassified Clostridium]MDR5586097.1 hypothetical protein [Clostridium sp. 5N-1]NFG62474.1 hypothetical protein [Clostridium botulinum]NFQ09006.1 hypothetical protein [Clostridium botulinum]
MIKVVNKVTSFLLLFFILVLSLNKLKVIDYSEDLRNIFYFLTLILTIFSAINVILTTNSKLFKFINIVIILNLIIGGIISILESGLNMYIYSCLAFTSIYCIIDMFYKKV